MRASQPSVPATSGAVLIPCCTRSRLAGHPGLSMKEKITNSNCAVRVAKWLTLGACSIIAVASACAWGLSYVRLPQPHLHELVEGRWQIGALTRIGGVTLHRLTEDRTGFRTLILTRGELGFLYAAPPTEQKPPESAFSVPFLATVRIVSISATGAGSRVVWNAFTLNESWSRNWSVRIRLLPFTALFSTIPVLHLLRALHSRRRWKHRAANGLCITCGYNLTGVMSPVCPECGSARP